MKTYEKSYQLMQQLPMPLTELFIINQMNKGSIDNTYLQAIKDISNLPDAILASILDITPKTYKTYITGKSRFKDTIQEQIILLLDLYKHGFHVFSSEVNFQQWLERPNFYLDQKKPIEFLEIGRAHV